MSNICQRCRNISKTPGKNKAPGARLGWSSESTKSLNAKLNGFVELVALFLRYVPQEQQSAFSKWSDWHLWHLSGHWLFSCSHNEVQETCEKTTIFEEFQLFPFANLQSAFWKSSLFRTNSAGSKNHNSGLDSFLTSGVFRSLPFMSHIYQQWHLSSVLWFSCIILDSLKDPMRQRASSNLQYHVVPQLSVAVSGVSAHEEAHIVL